MGNSDLISFAAFVSPSFTLCFEKSTEETLSANQIKRDVRFIFYGRAQGSLIGRGALFIFHFFIFVMTHVYRPIKSNAMCASLLRTSTGVTDWSRRYFHFFIFVMTHVGRQGFGPAAFDRRTRGRSNGFGPAAFCAALLVKAALFA